MSMFRSAAEISSSDTQSSSDESDTGSVTRPIHDDGKGDVGETESASAEVEHETSKGSPRSGSPDVKGPSDVDAGGHANMMVAALLEFYCLSRAADILNAQSGSHGRFTRESPEVQYLGKRLYSYKSQFLSSHGVLASGIEKEDMRIARQYYRDNLDLLGASALEELKLDETQGRSRPSPSTGDLDLAPKAPRNRQLIADKEHTESEPPGTLGLRKLFQTGNRTGALEDISFDMGNLSNQSLPLFGSSPAGFPLFSAQLSPTGNISMSRYAMEFSEISALGRGSFGQVFHVMNHIDGQHYAVKKIPLSQKRLEQLQFGGENQLETIMKEIRTLARLEHTNVVRYYGAWVEQAQIGSVPAGLTDCPEPSYEPTQSNLLSNEPSENQDLGVVFEHEIESIPRDFNPPSYGQLSSYDPTDDDIFTDGMSQDQSKLQLQHRYRNGTQIPAVVLHIQMSLHPISLGSYLSPQPAVQDNQPFARRHCYHLTPSLRFMLAIISGVEYLHSKGIVHRDLKPANIFLSTPESSDLKACPGCQLESRSKSHYCNPRIGDFGLVADISHLNSTPQNPDRSAKDKPYLDHLVGTEFYRPRLSSNEPREFEDSKRTEDQPDLHTVDGKLDIYALGVILFELLYRLNTKMERQFVLTDLTRGNSPSGPTAFPGDFTQKVDMGPTQLDDGASVAESLMTCIKGMLEPNRQQRWNCSDIKLRLEKILAAIPSPEP
ncbi:STYKc [Aspergillus sp. HF37]|nr:STYKc [Aspergillus sp. HF37]